MLFQYFLNCASCQFLCRFCKNPLLTEKHAFLFQCVFFLIAPIVDSYPVALRTLFAQNIMPVVFGTFLIAPTVNSHAVAVKTACAPKSMHAVFRSFSNCASCLFSSRCCENLRYTEKHKHLKSANLATAHSLHITLVLTAKH